MSTIKVTFSDGDHLMTGINGTSDEVRAYYIGQSFDMTQGDGPEHIVRAVSVEFLEVPCAKAEVVCPKDNNPSGINGCGSTNVRGPDSEGLFDCLECGIWFGVAPCA